MAEIIQAAPLRAYDSNGDLVAAARLYVYDSGTTTEQTVYQDEGLTTPFSQPIEANGAGVFPPIFVASGSDAKVNVTDPDGVDLPGYPIDPVALGSTTASGASQISFSPVTGNAATNVQAAIENNTNAREGRSSDIKAFLAADDDAGARTELGLGDVAELNLADVTQDEATWLAGADDTDSLISPAILDAVIGAVKPQVIATWTYSSPVSSVDFTDLGDWDGIEIVWSDIDAGNNCGVLVSFDNGSIFEATGYLSSATDSEGSNASAVRLNIVRTGDNTDHLSGMTSLRNMTSRAVMSSSAFFKGRAPSAGGLAPAGTIDAIRLNFDATVSSGSVTILGIVRA